MNTYPRAPPHHPSACPIPTSYLVPKDTAWLRCHGNTHTPLHLMRKKSQQKVRFPCQPSMWFISLGYTALWIDTQVTCTGTLPTLNIPLLGVPAPPQQWTTPSQLLGLPSVPERPQVLDHGSAGQGPLSGRALLTTYRNSYSYYKGRWIVSISYEFLLTINGGRDHRLG